MDHQATDVETMRIKSESSNHLEATHRGATIEIEREDDGKFYIQVRWKDGGNMYDGWAPETVTTMSEAKSEAIRGAQLNGPLGASDAFSFTNT